MGWDTLHDLLAGRDRSGPSYASGSSWVPSVDLHETATEYVLVAELPGLTSDHFSVSATPNSLTLSGRRPEFSLEAQQFLRIERGHGAFSRLFTFPDQVDVAGIQANLRDGLLVVRIPRALGAQARRIDVE